jgi:hypothetical protein
VVGWDTQEEFEKKQKTATKLVSTIFSTFQPMQAKLRLQMQAQKRFRMIAEMNQKAVVREMLVQR